MLSLLRRSMPGPTLPSRLVEAADDNLRLVKGLAALLDKRRIKPLLLLTGWGCSTALGAVLLTLCGSEVLLVFLVNSDSGS